MASDKITAPQVLLPLCLLSFVVLLFLCFQTKILTSARSDLNLAKTQQDKPLEQLEKVKTQAIALALGTLKLAQGGNKDAENIIAAMKKAGIEVAPPSATPSSTAIPTPAPAAP